MTLAFELPDCPPSLVRRWDPRWKLAGLLLAAFALALLQTSGPALAALAGAVFLVALARLPLRWYLQRLGTAVVMFAMFFAWLPFVVETGHETFDIESLTFSWSGLMHLVRLSAKLAAMISLILGLLGTTPLHDIFKAARALHVPKLLVLLMLLTYRYVFLLTDEFARLRTALRVRGFRNRANLHSYRTIGQVAGSLLVRSHERSERVGHAMRARGFDGEFRTLDGFHAVWTDALGFGLIVGSGLALFSWDLCAR